MRTPTDVLRDEHVVILRALDVLERAAGRPDGGPPAAWWAEAVAWLRGFADANHHAKEEQSLFPAMIKAGVPGDGGPIAVMLEEHREGRALIQRMAGAEPGERASAARQYVGLLRAHIDKENGVLFAIAEGILDEGALRAVEREFEAVEVEQGKAGSIAAAEAAVERLAAAIR